MGLEALRTMVRQISEPLRALKIAMMTPEEIIAAHNSCGVGGTDRFDAHRERTTEGTEFKIGDTIKLDGNTIQIIPADK